MESWSPINSFYFNLLSLPGGLLRGRTKSRSKLGPALYYYIVSSREGQTDLSEQNLFKEIREAPFWTRCFVTVAIRPKKCFQSQVG